jgi:hypothetical protein
VLATAQRIAAGISAGMNGKPRAWSRDEQLDLVGELDKAATAYRAQQIKKGIPKANRSNGAASILNTWNSAGTLIFNGAITKLGIPDEDHAEQLIVDWTDKIIKTKIGQLQGATINLLIFSQTAVCPTCLRKAATGIWKTKLQVATGSPVGTVTTNINIWQWGTVNQSRYWPVLP